MLTDLQIREVIQQFCIYGRPVIQIAKEMSVRCSEVYHAFRVFGVKGRHRPKYCGECKKMFYSNRGDFCSDHCRKNYTHKKGVRQSREWRLKNPERRKEIVRRSAQKHRAARIERMRVARETSAYREKYRAYYKANRERIIKNSERWQRSERGKERRRVYNKNRGENPKHRLIWNLRRRILHVIQDNYRSKKSLELLGCDGDAYKKYLESKFKPGMTWENYGIRGWHIDHIVPLSAFDLSRAEQQAKAFHYTNTQPLWCRENCLKGGVPVKPNPKGGRYRKILEDKRASPISG